MLTAVAAQLFRTLNESVERKMARSASSARKRVQALTRTLIDLGLGQPNRYRLLWRRDLLDDSDAELQAEMDSFYDRLIDELESTGAELRFDRDTYAVALWSMVHGYVSLRLDGNLESRIDLRASKKREDAIVEAFLDAFTS